MNRIMVWTAALVVLAAGFAVTGTSEAEAGLFNRKSKCCKPARKSRRSRNKCCCEPVSCCEPAPCCEEPAPCCEATPACECAAAEPCGCAEVQQCGCETINCACLNRRQLRRAQRKGQCCGTQIQQCGCEAAAPAGCSECAGEAAPSAAPEAAPEAPESDSTT